MKLDPKLIGHVIGVTGSGPIPEHDCRHLLERDAAYIAGPAIWQREQVIVIGTDNFDKDYLRTSIEIGNRYNFKCLYMSQLDYFHYYDTGDPPTYSPNDPRVRSHPGLSFLSNLGFAWPTTHASPGIGHTVDPDLYNSASVLATRFGYSVAQGIPPARRHAVLNQAIQDPPRGLGLQYVAFYIADLIKWRKTQSHTRFHGAISRWQDDLDWLYQQYYLSSHHSFLWPSST